MGLEVLLALCRNALMLMALALLGDRIPTAAGRPRWLRTLLAGVVVGLVGVGVMSLPYEVQPGVLIDARSILLGTSGLFFGLGATLVGVTATIGYRLHEGGVGAATGVLLILASAAFGLAWRRWRPRRGTSPSTAELAGFGLLLHLVMLAVLATLPPSLAPVVIRQVALPVLAVFPAGTVLLGGLLKRQQERTSIGDRLAASERRFRKMVDQGWDIAWLLGPDLQLVHLSDSAERILGYTLSQLQGMGMRDLVHAEDQERALIKLKAIRDVPDATGQDLVRGRHRDGRWLWLEITLTNRLDDPDLQAIVVNARDVTERQAAHEALRASQAETRRYIDNAPHGVFLTDASGRHLEVNDEACRTLGLSRDQLLQLSLLEVIPASSHDAARRHFQTLLELGRASGVMEFRRGDGARGWWRVEAVRLGPERLLGFTTDITEPRQLQATLLEREAQLERAQQLGRIGSWELDLKAGVFRGSPQAWRLYGLTSGPQPAAVVRQVALPEDRSRLNRALADLIETGRPYDIEFRIRRADDGRIVDIHSRAVHQAERGVVEGTIQDITERKRAEAAIQESEARFRSLFEQAAVGMAQVAPDGRWLRVNQRLCEIVGYSREELLKTDFQDITHPDDLANDLQDVRRLLAGEIQSYTREKRYLRKDGGEVWVELTVGLTRDVAGEPLYFISVIADISGRHRAEQERDHAEAQLRQAQKMEAVGRLAGGVAHDFNNMLNVILGYADLALGEMPPEAPGFHEMQEVRGAARRSAELTRQLLAFSRKQIADPRLLDLNTVISEQLPMLRRLIGENIQVDFAPGDGLGCVRLDPSQVSQILANLFVNARDAIAGTGTVTIATGDFRQASAAEQAEFPLPPGRYVQLCFRDTGHGMDPETLDRVFEPFFTTKGEGKGTGLGLATVYGIVKQNGGFIRAVSAPGSGTAFHLTLPSFEGAAQAPEAARDGAPTTGHETILLAEDEPQVLDLARSLLERQGYQVLAAGSAEEALRLAGAHPGRIDLLLTDMIMPEIDGKELETRVRALLPDIRTLFMSGYTADTISHQGLLDPGLHFLQKPFSYRELAEKVRSVLDA